MRVSVLDDFYNHPFIGMRKFSSRLSSFSNRPNNVYENSELEA